jgi:pyruvate,water dikinase
VFRLVQGHVYVNATLVAEVMRELPTVFVSEGLLELLPGTLRESVRGTTRHLLSVQTIGTVVQLTRSERAWMPWSRAELFRREASAVGSDLAYFALPSTARPGEILAALGRVEERLAGYLEVVSWGMIYAYVFFHLTAQLLERWAPEESASIAQLTSGLPGIRTFEVHDELIACAERVRRDETLRRLVLEADAVEVAARCRRGELGRFGDAVQGVLARHGHRLIGRDLSFPTWRERPEVIVEMVRKLVCANRLPTAQERHEKRESLRERVLQRISAGPGGLVRREVFMRGLSWCQEYYAVRENMRYYADAFLAAVRGVALTGADLLVQSGMLHQREDVFYLTEAELRAALGDLAAGRVAAGAQGDAARARKREYEAFRLAAAPEIVTGDEPEPACAMPSPPPPRENVLLRGLGVSPGRVRGPARVVRTVDELQALRAGEVIVAPMTDPSWTSLLALGGALVLEVGGLLSHGAIVARELGIPAVVDVTSATSLLATGDLLAVDGFAGTVGVSG